MVKAIRVVNVLFYSDHLVHPIDNAHTGAGSKWWDRLLSGIFLALSSLMTLGGAEFVYLEDDAKIEGETGSYSLRLFRLIALDDRTSWYQDSYDYERKG